MEISLVQRMRISVNAINNNSNESPAGAAARKKLRGRAGMYGVCLREEMLTRGTLSAIRIQSASGSALLLLRVKRLGSKADITRIRYIDSKYKDRVGGTKPVSPEGNTCTKAVPANLCRCCVFYQPRAASRAITRSHISMPASLS